MNTPVRRVAIAVMVLIVALLVNITYVQVIRADSLRADGRNQRVLLDEYSRQRGQISTGGQVLASSIPTDDRFKYLRTYPPASAQAYAPVTGYYSLQYASSGTEKAEDPVLSGSDDRLFGRRLFDLIAGRDPRGGNVVLTLDPEAQQTAYDQMTSNGYRGSVVAIRPQTGEILAMVSTPSFDPNPLASHDADTRTAAFDALSSDPADPLTNRATQTTYPPGSTFKVVVTAAALAAGATPDTPLTAAGQTTLPGTTTTLENYNGQSCGSGATAPLSEAFARSCNTAFVELGIETGADPVRAQAEALGLDTDPAPVPLPVTASEVGAIPDDAALGQSSIGQRDVRVTPLQNAQIAAAVANGGVAMQPYLVSQLQAPDLSTLAAGEPQELGRAMSADVADQLTELMIGSENFSTGAGKINGVQIASKTGTAEHGEDPRNTPPHAWYIAFAPAVNPQVAIAVVVEDGGNASLAATGGSVAAPVARSVIASVLQEGG